MQNLFVKVLVLSGVIGGSCFVVWQAHESLNTAATHVSAGDFVELPAQDEPSTGGHAASTSLKSQLKLSDSRLDNQSGLDADSSQSLQARSVQQVSKPEAFGLMGEMPPSGNQEAPEPQTEMPLFFQDKPQLAVTPTPALPAQSEQAGDSPSEVELQPTPRRVPPDLSMKSGESSKDFLELPDQQVERPEMPVANSTGLPDSTGLPQSGLPQSEPLPNSEQLPAAAPAVAGSAALPQQTEQSESLGMFAAPGQSELPGQSEKEDLPVNEPEPTPALMSRFGPSASPAAKSVEDESSSELPAAPMQSENSREMPGLTKLPSSHPGPVLLTLDQSSDTSAQPKSEMNMESDVISAAGIESKSESIQKVSDSDEVLPELPRPLNSSRAAPLMPMEMPADLPALPARNREIPKPAVESDPFASDPFGLPAQPAPAAVPAAVPATPANTAPELMKELNLTTAPATNALPAQSETMDVLPEVTPKAATTSDVLPNSDQMPEPTLRNAGGFESTFSQMSTQAEFEKTTIQQTTGEATPKSLPPLPPTGEVLPDEVLPEIIPKSERQPATLPAVMPNAMPAAAPVAKPELPPVSAVPAEDEVLPTPSPAALPAAVPSSLPETGTIPSPENSPALEQMPAGGTIPTPAAIPAPAASPAAPLNNLERPESTIPAASPLGTPPPSTIPETLSLPPAPTGSTNPSTSPNPSPLSVFPNGTAATVTPPQPVSAPQPSPLIGTTELDANAPSGPQSPELKIEKVAPTEAEVGEPVIYSILIRNVGGSDARDVVVEDRIPRGAQLEGTIPQAYLNEGKLSWHLGTIESGGERKIQLKVVPIEAGQIGSVATVSFASAVSASIKVTAPKLSIDMTGPNEVVMGELMDFQFTLRNQGQGIAKSVYLRAVLPEGLQHPGGNDLEYESGVLAPGGEKVIDLQVQAERPGVYTILAQATNDGKVHAETRSDIAVIKARVELSRTAPDNRFVGRAAKVTLRIANTSSELVQGITIQERVPHGVELVGLPGGGRWDANGRLITWKMAELKPGEAREINLVYVAREAGEHLGAVVAVDEAGNRSQIETRLNAKGFAELTPVYSAEQRTVFIGDRVTLQMTLKNGGTATGRNIRAEFVIPDELEFVSAGGPVDHQLNGNKVQFKTIDQLGIGATETFNLAMTAASPGTCKVTLKLESDDYSDPVYLDEAIRILPLGP